MDGLGKKCDVLQITPSSTNERETKSISKAINGQSIRYVVQPNRPSRF